MPQEWWRRVARELGLDARFGTPRHTAVAMVGLRMPSPSPKVYEDRQDGPEEDDSPDNMVPASSLAPKSGTQGCAAPICRPRSAAKGTVC